VKTLFSTFYKWALPGALFTAFMVPAAQGQTVDIRSYGARCDGSDDSAAVQAAIDAVSSGTVTISCSAGIGARGILLSNKSNVTVAGNGGSAGFRALARTSQGAGNFGPVMFLIQNCTNCVGRDLAIDAQNVALASIGFDRNTNSKLQNVSVVNTAYPANAAIVAVSGHGNTYTGNTVRSCGYVDGDGTRGMWIGNQGYTEYNATISNNTVSEAGWTGIATHVINATITGNLSYNNRGAGIKVVPAAGEGGQTNVQGNTLRGNLFHGVQVDSADSPVNVVSNTIDANKIAGVYCMGGRYYGRITGNTITNQPEAAIYLYNADGVTIDNNKISGNGHGILMEATSGNTMHDLQITSNTISGQSAHGITMWGRGGTVQNVAITSNSIYNGSIYGLFVEQLSGSLAGISASSNCYANDAAGSIYDNRGLLSPVAQSGSCAPAGSGTATADNTKPSVSITAPANGATVNGTVTVTSAATDNVGVTGVQFQLNGANYGSKLSAAPYTVQWDTKTVANGSYQWNAVAQDAAGNTATSTTVFAVVNNPDTIAPSVRILTPATGSTLSGTVSITASASDNIGVAGVQYSLDGAPLGSEATASPYTLSWNTGTVAQGSHTLTATARDAAGNRSTASVTVALADTTAPSVSITSPTAGQTVGGTFTITATANDNVGVAGVQFLVDGAAYGAEVSSGYSVSCNSATLTNGSHAINAVARDAAGNKKTSATVTITVSNPTTPVSTTKAVVRVNAGGPAYTDPSGNAWSADTGFNGGYVYAPGISVSGTTAPALYASTRWTNGPLTYTFSVPNGSYTVNLKFAELYMSGAGQRVMNISVNGQTLESNFDIFAAAGGAKKAVDRSYPVTLTGGTITIQLSPNVENPTISAIEILTATTTGASTPPPASSTTSRATARINVCGGAYTDPSGIVWSADSGYNAGTCDSTTKSLSGTTTPALYQTQRWYSGTLIYTFAVANGNYTINLKFAEIYFGSANQRVFNIAINGLTVATQFDIFAAAGGAGKAIDKSFPVSVTNGAITISLTPLIENPAMNAIEILPATTSSATPTTSTVAVARINACGGAYTDPSGNVWSADYGFGAGSCDNSTTSIGGTTAQALYQNQRWSNDALTYQIPVANGTYTVNLKFAELYFTSAGQRVFNIVINGQTVVNGFDMVAAAGGAGKAIDKSFQVSVTGGVITITLNPSVQQPAINAIELLKTTTN